MRSFLAKLAPFLGLQAVIFTTVFWLSDRHGGGNYLSANIDKHARLQIAPQPRVIFIGGSSVAFGLDSAMIHYALGRHEVNLGLNAGLGMDFIIGDVPTEDLREGDLVVVSLEYEHFCADQASIGVLYDALRSRPASLWSLDFAAVKTLFDQGLFLIPTYVDRTVKLLAGRSAVKVSAGTEGDLETTTSIYTRQGFNVDGDFVKHWVIPVPEMKLKRRMEKACKPNSLIFSSSELERVACRLNRFARVCDQRGAKIFFVYAALPEPVFRANQATIERIDQALRRVLKIPILQTPQTAVAPTSDFFDTVYHLNRDGVTWRSREISSVLKAQLKS